MSEEQIEAIYQHACEGAAESIGHTRENWQQVVYAIRELRRERDESRRLLDEALAQEPVAYLHNKRVDVIHTSVKSLLSDFAVNYGPESMLRPIDKSEHYTIPLYAAPVPAQPAADVAAIAKAVRDIPSRLESLGGQRFAYVKLSEVIDTIYSVAGKQPAVPDAKPFAWGVEFDGLNKVESLVNKSADVLRKFTGIEPFPLFRNLAVPEAVAKDAARLSVWVSDICNAYESGVGHAGRPTAKVNPYREGTHEHEAYAIGANGVKGSFSNHALLCELLPVLDEVMAGGVAEDLLSRLDGGQSINTVEGKAWLKLRAILSATDTEVKK